MTNARFETKETQGDLKIVNFNEITHQGCYVLLDTGQLVRVPTQAIGPEPKPTITIHQQGITRAALLTDNDAEKVSTLRDIALNNDIQPKF